jgi:hypothetical protein
MVDLGTFEGRKVTKTTISVRNAGDGLSQAMAVDPQLLHQSDTVYVVIECKVGPVSFDPIKDSETECERKHVLKAGAATTIDAALVKDVIAAQTAKIIEKITEPGMLATHARFFGALFVGKNHRTKAAHRPRRSSP